MGDKPSKTKIVVRKHKYRPKHAKRKTFIRHRSAQFMSFILVLMLANTMLPLSAIARTVGDVNATLSETASIADTGTDKAEASADKADVEPALAPEQPAVEVPEVVGTPTRQAPATAASTDKEPAATDENELVTPDVPATDDVASDYDAACIGADAVEDDLTDGVDSADSAATPVEPSPTAPSAADPDMAPMAAPLEKTLNVENVELNIKWIPVSATMNRVEITASRDGFVVDYDTRNVSISSTYWSGSWVVADQMFNEIKPSGNTLDVRWKQYPLQTVTYTHDGNGDFEPITHTSLITSERMPDPPGAPGWPKAKPGYEFAGWEGNIPATVGSGGIYKATYVQTTSYTIIYKPGDYGIWNPDNHRRSAYDGDATPNFQGDLATEHEPTHIFAGWLKEGTEDSYRVGEPLPSVKGDATYIAQWTPYNPIFESVDEYKVYDGEALTTDEEGNHFVIGGALPYYVFTYSDKAEVTDATGASVEHNNTARVEIYFRGERVTDMFSEIGSEVEPGTETGYYTNWGTLTVNKRPVTLTSNSASKPYDGTPLVSTVVSVESPLETPWATGEGFFLEATGSITDVGTAENTIAYTPVGDTTKISNYDITTVQGTLTITENSDPIVVTTPSASKPYDGLPLTNAAYSVSGLPAEHRLVVTVTGEQVEVGNSQNLTAGDYTIFNQDNVDVTRFFTNISEANGTLTVTAATVVPDPDPDDGVVVPIVPAAPAPTPAPAPLVVIPDAEVPLDDGTTEAETPVIDTPEDPVDDQVIIEDPVPLGPPAATDYWALLNLILAVLTAVFALVLIVVVATRRKKDKQDSSDEKVIERTDSDENTTKRVAVWPAILSVLAAIGGVVLFVLTENVQLPITMVDQWTLWQAVICVASIVLLAVGARGVKKASDQRAQEPR